MPKKIRVNRKFVVNYEPTELGMKDYGIEAGIQGEFETEDEARAAAKSCLKWFNEPVTLEAAEDAESGRTVMVKRRMKINKVRVWIEQYLDNELVPGDVPCEEKSPASDKRPNTSSTKAAVAAG